MCISGNSMKPESRTVLSKVSSLIELRLVSYFFLSVNYLIEPD